MLPAVIAVFTEKSDISGGAGNYSVLRDVPFGTFSGVFTMDVMMDGLSESEMIASGDLKIEWVRRHMPVLEQIRKDFEKEKIVNVSVDKALGRGEQIWKSTKIFLEGYNTTFSYFFS